MSSKYVHILILDFGSQFTQLIARRVRENNFYCEVWPYNSSVDKIKKFAPSAIILSGGPASTIDTFSPKPDMAIFSLGLPMLGICYGQQIICSELGGKVEPSDKREFGRAMVKYTKKSPLFDGVWNLGEDHQVWMSHGDKVVEIPDNFVVDASTPSCPHASISCPEKKIYAVQFHLEVMHTTNGSKIINNFLTRIADLKPDWTIGSFHQEALEVIRNQVGSGRVICGVSGGVDSTVVAKLLHEAIGEQSTCIFVDTGLLRHNEGDEVEEMFRNSLNIPLIRVNAGSTFLKKLNGISDPETKRKIIGETFIEVFEEEALKHGHFDFLAQGTLYPDVIESVTFHGGPSATIKSHHNVGGLPDRMRLKLVEPLRQLFKDEVRALARELKIPEKLFKRHPFPGPGLAIRIPGEITSEKVALLQKADAIYIEEIQTAGLYDEIWQAFAVLLPVKSVGVMGDGRTYDYVAALRAVTSTDGMTADFYHFNWQFLANVSARIVNEVRGINRIVYDVTSKPPGTIEWE